MVWFRKEKKPKKPLDEKPLTIPEGLWIKCEGCKETIYKKEVEANLHVCPKCDYHFRISAATRLDLLFDGSWKEFAKNITSSDPLEFEDTRPYKDRLVSYQKRAGKRDAVRCAEGKLDKNPVVIAAMEYKFMGGSMGSVVGEKITLAAERSFDKRLPLIVVSASGGARMQEGILSLMQMAKIAAALSRLSDEGIPYVSVLTDPTTGGVTASFAMLGDINIGEPHALIGFAGPRVIEQTIRQKLPEGFQRSEFLLEHGMLDSIVSRHEMKSYISRFLRFATA